MPFHRHRKYPISHNPKNTSHTSLILFWSYKLLVEMNLWHKLKGSHLDDDDIFSFLGLEHLRKEDELTVSKKELLRHLKKELNNLEKQNPRLDPVLVKNIDKLVKVINLNSVEKQILSFVVILHSTKAFSGITDKLGELSLKDIFDTLSFLLKIPQKEIKEALNTSNTLFQSGLLKVDRSCANELQRRLELMDGLEDILLVPDVKLSDIFERYFNPAGKAELKRDDFDYLSEQIELIERLLILDSSKGMNILIYGPPGTGKSEIAKMLAESIGFQLHEISMSDEDGDPIRGSDRFSAFRLAQQVLKRKKKNMIIFDEIEDVFPSSFISFFGMSFGNSNDNKGQKAWINRLLESNKVPSIWISNTVDQIDDAYKRRFKFVLKIDIPPQKTRLKIVKDCIKDLPVTHDWLNSIAKSSQLSPALISQSVQVVSLMNQQDSNAEIINPQKIESDLNQILNNSLEVMGKKKLQVGNSLTPIHYNIDVLNPDRNIKELVKGLNRQQQGRICLYGPPGTGKTAFGHYVAKQLDKKLVVKRASDLIDKYVGESEKNIALMFDEAKNENAVLLLDEADSFLRDRKGANRSWEVTQVNELLTQMESYEGIFICSTNLIDNIDEASIRRFDLKIKLDYCQAEQVWRLFKQVLKQASKEQGSHFAPKKAEKLIWKQQLYLYHNLTPGDFATVVRQNRLSAEPLNSTHLLEGLKQESEFKSGEKNHRGIGFSAKF